MEKKVLMLLITLALSISCSYADTYNVYVGPQNSNNYQTVSTNSTYSTSSSRYDYAYDYPPRQGIQALGRYLKLSSRTIYVPSVSKLKRARHSERINANNRLYAYRY